MARSTVAQVVQIGDETTPGTAVPADKRLGSLSIPLSPEVESTAFRPRGTKYATVVAANKEWATGSVEGTPTYDEVIYPLSGVFSRATVAQVLDGATPTGAYSWTFEPSSTEADTPATFTVEQGDATLAERAAHLMFTEFGMEFTRGEVTLSGSVLAKALERGLTLTADPTPVAADLVPILPGQVCVYAAATHAALDEPGSHVTNGLAVSPTIGDRFSPVWFLNCQEDSYSAVVEQAEPSYEVGLTIEADATGLSWADLFRTGATSFLRIEAKGPMIDGATEAARYRLTWDLAVKVLNPGAYSDEDGLHAIQPSLQVVHDPTWGRASKVTVVNTVANL